MRCKLTLQTFIRFSHVVLFISHCPKLGRRSRDWPVDRLSADPQTRKFFSSKRVDILSELWVRNRLNMTKALQLNLFWELLSLQSCPVPMSEWLEVPERLTSLFSTVRDWSRSTKQITNNGTYRSTRSCFLPSILAPRFLHSARNCGIVKLPNLDIFTRMNHKERSNTSRLPQSVQCHHTGCVAWMRISGVFEKFVSMKIWNQFENKIHRKNLQPFKIFFVYLAYFSVPNWRCICKQNTPYFLQNRQSFLSNRPNSHSRHTPNTCSAPTRRKWDYLPAKFLISKSIECKILQVQLTVG
jgi:hypothetical protein